MRSAAQGRFLAPSSSPRLIPQAHIPTRRSTGGRATLLLVHPLIAGVLADQSGVISRRQVLEAGLHDHDVARLVRRREIVRLHPGVYIDHTGTPTWHQLAWGAVLVTWPSALSHASALRAAEGPGSSRRALPIEVVVDRDRTLRDPDGVRVYRSDHLEEQVQWHVGPPRVRYEHAAIDV